LYCSLMTASDRSHIYYFPRKLTCVEDKDIALLKLAAVSDVTLIQTMIFVNLYSHCLLMMLMYFSSSRVIQLLPL
jgi:hypothetical protein